MNYTQSVPSRELCEELARLGIFQDEPELWYSKDGYIYCEDEYYCDNNVPTKEVVAPTLPSLMSEFPVYAMIEIDCDRSFIVRIPMSKNNKAIMEEDKHLPNAIARALIAIKKGNV